MSDYICNSEKFVYSKGYIFLPIELKLLPQSITIGNVTLQLKSSFHVSLVCVKNILAGHEESARQALEQKIISLFCSFTARHALTLKQYKDFRFVELDTRKAVMVRVEIQNLAELFDYLRSELQLAIDTPPTHITLYTLQPNAGIGVNTNADLASFTQDITEKTPSEIKEIVR